MLVNIITNLNGYGLQRDCSILAGRFLSHGWQVNEVQFDAPNYIASADVNLFLEVVVPELFSYAKENWVIPNPEWWHSVFSESLPKIDRVLCKTQDALRIFRQMVGEKAEYIGFESVDQLVPTTVKSQKFLHVAGKSEAKNTAAVIEAWQSYCSQFPLTLITSQPKFIQMASTVPSIELHTRVTNDELLRMMNSHRFHLCPSKYEGWGHYFHEALSTGAVIVTTDAPPMNEFGGVSERFRVKASNAGQMRLANLSATTAKEIADAVHAIAATPSDLVMIYSAQARKAFEAERQDFRERFAQVLGKSPEVVAAPPAVEVDARPLTVAVFGNHSVSYCTEEELSWTFEHLGHRVLRFQENQDTTDFILEQCKRERADLFIYVHTHGWTTPGLLTMDQLLSALESYGIRTASFHLDLYWGLNLGDRRQDKIGQHPFWQTSFVFTADGGHQNEFAARGVKHFWLPPAVVERACYPGNFRPEFATDIAFVGARSYHMEYKFRAQLIDWLQQTYGPRFKRFNGDTTGVVREHALNDLYASVKVVVGDSCFAGIPKYWSDRVPETLGRGGFLIHPRVEGLEIPGLVTYTPGDLGDLKQKIDYYLSHEDERLESIRLTSAEVKKRHTYTNRVRQMLTVMGLRDSELELECLSRA